MYKDLLIQKRNKIKNNNKNKVLKYTVSMLIASIGFISYGNGADSVFPGGCIPTGFSFKYYVLHLHPNKAGNSQFMYFIHNKSNKAVTLYQMRTGDEAYIMHLNNRISPNRWGAYAAKEKEVKFICTYSHFSHHFNKFFDFCHNEVWKNHQEYRRLA